MYHNVMNTIHRSLTGRGLIIVVVYSLLLFTNMFASYDVFVEAEVVSKWYAYVGVGCVFILTVVFSSKQIEISFSKIDMLIIIFVLYLFARMLLNELTIPIMKYLSLFIFLMLYFIFKLVENKFASYFNSIIIIVCVLQALYGIGHFIGIYDLGKGFRITGSFDNPAGYAACIAVGFPFCLTYIQNGSGKLFGIVMASIIVLAIILSESRSSIFAISAITLFYLIKRNHKSNKHHLMYCFGILLSLMILITFLFFLKKNSAIGRTLIWYNTINMIANKPIFGHGQGAFLSKYMQYQGDYFHTHNNDTFELLADSVTHPLNEYLLLTVEHGLVGITLLSVILFWVLFVGKGDVYSMCLLSVIVLSLFSYPFKYSFIAIIAAYCMSSITKNIKQTYTINVGNIGYFIKTINIVLFSVVIFGYLIRDIRFEKKWAILARSTVFKSKQEVFREYSTLYNDWNGDPLFLYNYASILNKYEYYGFSNELSEECKLYYNCYNIQLIIADNYEKLNMPDLSEKHYHYAKDMIPNRFYPLYKLMLLYNSTGNTSMGINVAKEIVHKEVKIPSYLVNKIKKEAANVILKSE